MIFSHLGHVTMAAKAPDPPMSSLGCMEEAKNELTGGNTTGTRERELKINKLHGLFCVWGRCLLHFHSNSCFS